MSDIATYKEPEHLEEGSYPAVLDGTKIVDGKYGERRQVTWRVLDHRTSKGEPFVASTWCDLSFGSRAKANDWLEALGAPRLSLSHPIVDWSELVGRPVTLLLSIGENGYNEVQKVSPPRVATAPQATNGTTEAVAEPASTSPDVTDPVFQEWLAQKRAAEAATDKAAEE
jgi:hypothetical protein